jgi:hypothetical protein
MTSDFEKTRAASESCDPATIETFNRAALDEARGSTPAPLPKAENQENWANWRAKRD